MPVAANVSTAAVIGSVTSARPIEPGLPMASGGIASARPASDAPPRESPASAAMAPGEPTLAVPQASSAVVAAATQNPIRSVSEAMTLCCCPADMASTASAPTEITTATMSVRRSEDFRTNRAATTVTARELASTDSTR